MGRDSETNFDHTQFRQYYPSWGRWLSPDPLGGDVTNPQTWNRYAYVANNPTNATDPLGLRMSSDMCTPFECEGGGGGGGSEPWCLACGGLGGSFSGWESMVDGAPTDPGVASGLMQMGAGVQCPGPCSGVATDQWGTQHFVQYSAFAGLAAGVNGYYATWGVGSLQYTAKQAGISASLWGGWYLKQTGSESGGSLWCAYGICSSTLQNVGAPGAQGVGLAYDFSDIPDGTVPAGWWSGASGESPPHDLELVEQANAQHGTSFPMFRGMATEQPHVLYYGPENGWQECYLVGGLWTYAHSDDVCH